MNLRTELCATILSTAVISSFAAEAFVEAGGALHVEEAKASFAPGTFLKGWRSVGSSGGYNLSGDGLYHYAIKQDGTTHFTGTAEFADSPEGVKAKWTLVNPKDVDIETLYVGAAFSYSEYAGGSALCDGQRVEYPDAQPADPGFFRGKVSTLVLRDRTQAERIRITFPEPTQILLQDNRRWGGNDFGLRMQFAGGALAANAVHSLSATFSLADKPLKVVQSVPVKITAGAEWTPVVVEGDIEPGSALDFSTLVPRDAPAGRHGYVVARGGHFEFENLPGVSQRFYGVNLCFGANFVDRASAQRFARHLARIGYNAIRFHHHDGGLVKGSADGTTLDPKQLELFDGLAAACIENGLYITTDLYVSRSVPARSCGIDRDGNLSGNEYKMLVQFHEGVFQNYLQFARQWLGHVNPYTGRRYADEPAFALISLVNEANLGNYGADILRKSPDAVRLWEAWLAERKAKDPATYGAIPATMPSNMWEGDRPEVGAFVQFLREREELFARRVTDFLRNEMKCRALTTNMNCWFYPLAYQLPRAESYDYVDDHFYVDHPQFIERSWSLPSRCPNTNPMLGSNMGAQGLVMRRVMNRPFTITEYNYSAPGRFRGVGGIATGASAALQDWAGLWRFAWSHNETGVVNPPRKSLAYFDMSGDPLSLAAERASICLFLRRDLPVLSRTYAAAIPRETLLSAKAGAQTRSNWAWAAWYAKTGMEILEPGSTAPERPLSIPAAEVRKALVGAPDDRGPGDGAVSIDSKRGTFLLRTERTCGGFAEGGVIEADALTADLGATPATLWASSLDDQPLRASRRILVTHLTDVQDSELTYADRAQKILLSWGHLPHLMRNGAARVRLQLAQAEYTVWALSTGGRRIAKIPASFRDGTLEFEAKVARDPASATFLYEVARND